HREVDVPREGAVAGRQVVADRRSLVERDLDGAVDGFQVRLLERPPERDPQRAIDRRGLHGPADSRQLDGTVDDVAGDGSLEAGPEDLPVGRLEADVCAGWAMELAVHAGAVPAAIAHA